jgi:ABC-type nitrate/sulfonate/bicarbonate transport system permease component
MRVATIRVPYRGREVQVRSHLPTSILRRWLTPIFAFALLILVWHVVATSFFKPIFFPAPLAVAQTAVKMVGDGVIFGHIGASLQRIMFGFLLGSMIGAPIGLLIGAFGLVRGLIDPYVNFFRFVPAIAWLTPAIIWFGIGETAMIVIIVYTTIFIVVINTSIGVSNVAPNKIWAARSLGADRGQVFLHVIAPASVPFILGGMRIAMGLSVAVIVAAEMIGADRGLGFLIWNSRIWMQTDVIFLVIVLLGVLGFTLDQFFRLLIRRFASRYGPAE